MEKNKIYCGDALEVLKTFSDESVNCCVTSPPYYGLRDYRMDGQIGLEMDYNLYVNNLEAVFSEVKRVLKNDGTLWLNMGDTYTGSGKGAWNNKELQKEIYVPDPHDPQCKIKTTYDNIGRKNLLGIPWRVAFALQQNG